MFFENLNFYFMKTANIPVYGNVACMEISRFLTKNRLYTKMLRIHVFSVVTIKTPQALAALVPLGFLIVKTLTDIL